MPRIIKHPDIRRDELLAIAAELFSRKGYDATSIDDILRVARLSKGAFYHYFASKEALLEALAARVARAALARLGDVLTRPDRTAVERLNELLARGRRRDEGDANVAIFGPIFRPENAILYHRLHTAVMAVMLPPLTAIIAQGVAEASMQSSDPATTAEIILTLGAITHDPVARLLAARSEAEAARALEALHARLEQQGLAVDRILGLPDGTITFWDEGYREQWSSMRSSRTDPGGATPVSGRD